MSQRLELLPLPVFPSESFPIEVCHKILSHFVQGTLGSFDSPSSIIKNLFDPVDLKVTDKEALKLILESVDWANKTLRHKAPSDRKQKRVIELFDELEKKELSVKDIVITLWTHFSPPSSLTA